MFKDSTVLITGGTGTLGHALTDRLLGIGVKEVRIFSRDERKQEVFRNAIRTPRVKFFIGDVRNRSSLLEPLRDVDFVVHAAALKQVPVGEFFPMETIQTNVLGSDNVLSAAIVAGVKKVVVSSTDKACYPINAYGQSKALLEKVMVAKSRQSAQTIFCGTRYGNVLGSRGSVVPLFMEQVKSGKPLTITNPLMTRFLMTIDEAVDLVLYAFETGKQGDIFVKKSPASTVQHIAEAVLSAVNPTAEMRIIGTRHGEKLYETLVTSEEMAHAEEHGKCFRLPADVRDMNYSSYESKGEVLNTESYTSHNTRRMDLAETVDFLRGFIDGISE